MCKQGNWRRAAARWLIGGAGWALTGAVLAAPVFINEIHYDNSGGDVGEGVEIAGPAGTDLAGWQLLLYNGGNGSPYRSLGLSGVIPNLQAGFGVVGLAISGLQNGSADGLALVDDASQVLQFLSYEGSLDALTGLAAGRTSVDIGVAESSSTARGLSLQLAGSGSVYADFSWHGPSAYSFGALNSGQVFSAPLAPPPPSATAPLNAEVPLPSSLLLLGIGALGLAAGRRCQRGR